MPRKELLLLYVLFGLPHRWTLVYLLQSNESPTVSHSFRGGHRVRILHSFPNFEICLFLFLMFRNCEKTIFWQETHSTTCLRNDFNSFLMETGIEEKNAHICRLGFWGIWIVVFNVVVANLCRGSSSCCPQQPRPTVVRRAVTRSPVELEASVEWRGGRHTPVYPPIYTHHACTLESLLTSSSNYVSNNNNNYNNSNNNTNIHHSIHPSTTHQLLSDYEIPKSKPGGAPCHSVIPKLIQTLSKPLANEGAGEDGGSVQGKEHLDHSHLRPHAWHNVLVSHGCFSYSAPPQDQPAPCSQLQLFDDNPWMVKHCISQNLPVRGRRLFCGESSNIVQVGVAKTIHAFWQRIG